MTRTTMFRVGRLYGLVWIAVVLIALGGEGNVKLAALGLLWPGAGHLASGHLGHALLAVAAFTVSLLVWWMIGAAVAPILVWAGLLVGSTFTHHADHLSGTATAVTIGLVPAAAAVLTGIHAVRHHRQLATARTINAELASVEFFESAVPSSLAPVVRAASADDLAHLRFALDLALQPLSDFVGFDRRDQFREAALRYQLSILGYALSLYRYTHTPAFSGYLAEAQQTAVLKMGDRRVWGYWPLENAWGRGAFGRDPVRNHDNVMLTGWQGAAVGMYESFGDDRFSRPGGLTYTWSEDVQYRHDFHALASSIHGNMRRSPFTLFSCEPRWIYPVCNTFGVSTLILHDRLHHTDHYAELEESISRSYEEEFQRPDGKLIGVRNETLGVSWNVWAGAGVSLPTTYWMNAFLPAHAHRSWWLTRRDGLTFDGEHYRLPRSAATRCDVGDYSFGSDAFAHVLLSLTARELGDEALADNAFHYVNSTQHVDRRAGVSRYDGLSTQGNLYALMARFSRPGANRDLVGAGLPDRWLSGPHLTEAAYPDVLVARAVTDGHALDLVLEPGAGPGRVTLVLGRLRPCSTYRVIGAVEHEVDSDSEGRARLRVDVERRSAVRIEPTS